MFLYYQISCLKVLRIFFDVSNWVGLKVCVCNFKNESENYLIITKTYNFISAWLSYPRCVRVVGYDNKCLLGKILLIGRPCEACQNAA